MRSSNTRKITLPLPSILKIILPLSLVLMLGACASTIDGLKNDIRKLSGSEAPEQKGALIKTSANATSPMVKKIQEKLSSLGYKPGNATGTVNTKTESAIQDFQLDNDMVIDGKPSKSLLRALNSQEQS